ncbi:cytochrome P450 [Nonomuraea angiospora]|uniref:cytochrome P450 n=1 Tax=Nonomuraea angiospora TaxID=46172 RepID=UPI0029A13958|nr:cytochrome P450 [Nonomuraea angiospora]MDX3108923.1 cytochrome P450 [Nonomuraea angiospora]
MNREGTCPVAHGPRGLPVIGDAIPYFKDPLAYTLRMQERDSLVSVQLPIPFVQITEPEAIERVLRVNPDNYQRGTLYQGFFGMMGTGLLTLDTDGWRGPRRAVQPAFTPQRVTANAREAVAATRAVLRRWSEHAASGAVVDVAPELMDVSGRVMGMALVGRDLSGTDYSRAAAIANKVIYTSTIKGFSSLIPSFVPTRYHRARKWANRVLDGIIRQVIEERRAAGEPGSDAAGLLLAAGLSDTEVSDNLRTLLLAGSDTTGQALAWTMYELARHPQARRAVEREVDEVLAGDPPDPERLGELPQTTAAVNEALRLHPPVWQFPRDTVEPDTLAGRHVPAGTTVLLSVYGTHRSPEHWTDPEAYDPQRFLDGAQDGRHKHAFLPFGGGRRMCIGKGLAMATLVTAVAMLSQRYRLRLPGTRQVRSGHYITLFPSSGLPAVVQERA